MNARVLVIYQKHLLKMTFPWFVTKAVFFFFFSKIGPPPENIVGDPGKVSWGERGGAYLIKHPKKDMNNVASSTIITVPLKFAEHTVTNSTRETLRRALSN